MADHARLAASLLGVGSLLCQLILLVMQLRTYRRTGHSSLLILAIATALAVLYLGSGFAAAVYASTPSVLSRLYLGMEVLFVVQAVLGIWEQHRCFAHSLPATHRAILKLIAPSRPMG